MKTSKNSCTFQWKPTDNIIIMHNSRLVECIYCIYKINVIKIHIYASHFVIILPAHNKSQKCLLTPNIKI